MMDWCVQPDAKKALRAAGYGVAMRKSPIPGYDNEMAVSWGGLYVGIVFQFGGLFSCGDVAHFVANARRYCQMRLPAPAANA